MLSVSLMSKKSDQKGLNGCCPESSISFQAKLPLPLKQAMTRFIDQRPHWDQYRILQAALAGFLIQNGVKSREINRMYISKMFKQSY